MVGQQWHHEPKCKQKVKNSKKKLEIGGTTWQHVGVIFQF